jgi:hypothetical protein
MAQWQSFDKVDWAIRGPGFCGTAFLSGTDEFEKCPAHLLVHGFTEGFATEQLHQVLWLTHEQFPDVQLWCEALDALGNQLRELAERGAIQLEPMALGRYHIPVVSRPLKVGEGIQFLPEMLWQSLLRFVGSIFMRRGAERGG